MPKNLKQHEEINLHIRKSTFYAALRFIFAFPLAAYLIICTWMFPRVDYNSQMLWYDYGVAISMSLISIIYLVAFIKFIRWKLD